LNPQFAAPYGLIAVQLAAGKRDNKDLTEALSLAKKAVLLQPGNTTYQLDFAEVLARMSGMTKQK
jgi:hypothetical protein